MTRARRARRTRPDCNALLVGYAAFGGGFDALDVLVERAARGLERRRFPALLSALELGLRHLQIDAVLDRVDRDAIAVVDERDRPAFLRFGRDVSDQKAVRAAAEA